MKHSMISYAVKDTIVEYIETSGMRPGDVLPSERSLCRELGLNRNTFRAVMREMVITGDLMRGNNAQYYLPKPRLRMNLWEFNSLSNTIRSMGMTFERRLLAADLIEADKSLARRLTVEPGAKLYALSRLAFVEGEPLVVEESYLIASCCRGLLKFDLAKHSLYDILREEYGVHLKNQFIEVYTEKAGEWDAGLLQIAEGDPLMVSRGYAHDRKGNLTEMSVSKAVAARYEFEGYAGRKTSI